MADCGFMENGMAFCFGPDRSSRRLAGSSDYDTEQERFPDPGGVSGAFASSGAFSAQTPSRNVRLDLLAAVTKFGRFSVLLKDQWHQSKSVWRGPPCNFLLPHSPTAPVSKGSI